MSQVEWYYARDNRQMGPISSLELKRLATFDELRPDDLVWREGMTEWAAARNVRGLFDQDAGTAAAAGAAAPKIAEAPAQPQDAAAAPRRRHPFDALMEKFRPHFNPHFVEATAGIFRVCGSYGLLLAAVLTAAFAAIATAKASDVGQALWGAVWLLLLVVLQYVAGRSFAAIDELNGSTTGRLASPFVPDATAALSLVGGIAALLGSIAWAIQATEYLGILGGVAGFFVCAYLSVIALHPSMLNITVASEVLAGEELIGVLMFLLKALLRLAPVAFGAGVVCGTVAIAVACFLASVGESAFPDSLATACIARCVLISSAALPLAAYLLFLFCNLVMSLWRAVLSLPGKLDVLADGGGEIGRGQPDTVTTHE
jgi:hypothetical protein